MTAAIPAPVAPARRGLNRMKLLLIACALSILLAAGYAFFPLVIGYALYHGYLPVTARIVGHDSDLPQQASRCANCHDRPSSRAAAVLAIAQLNGDRLLGFHSRRGGPTSSYSEEAFCAVLRDGIDPVLVMVNRTMPRFDMSPANCHAIWRYVTSR